MKAKNKYGLNETPDGKGVSLEAGLPTNSSSSSLSINPVKLKNETKKRKVAFISVKPPPVPSSTTKELRVHLKGMEENGQSKEDPLSNPLPLLNSDLDKIVYYWSRESFQKFSRARGEPKPKRGFGNSFQPAIDAPRLEPH
ncbi:hypothetical protein BUALT_Bualt18G0064600 [Buddleja alternifolia]|uniref:Uncharacterized protein n=1 Tax=Buddleja alternifolia TaxID=168488 RepID=A0AAV6W232_9LAMI|nr:hypothetical protein BUALT_Bualt18G0064600 [Buddleja alternifolia]